MSLYEIHDKIYQNRMKRAELIASIQETWDKIAGQDAEYEQLKSDAVELFRYEGANKIPDTERGTLSFTSYTKKSIPFKVAQEVLDEQTLKRITVEEPVEYVRWYPPKENKNDEQSNE